MVGQIGHRQVAGASCRTCADSAPQRAPTARKCTVRTTLAPSAQAALLGGPFGHAEQAIRHHQDDLLVAGQRRRSIGIPVNFRRYSRDDPGELIMGGWWLWPLQMAERAQSGR